MAQNVYECMFIFDPNKYARDPGGVSGAAAEMVKSVQGEVLADRLWTEQKMAYPIKGNRKGTYWLTYFRMDSNKLDDFNRLCQLNENVLRNLVLRIDPRLVDALVSHALGKSSKTSPRESSSPAKNGAEDSDEPNAKEKTKAEVADASTT